jgi:hypothetical protein
VDNSSDPPRIAAFRPDRRYTLAAGAGLALVAVLFVLSADAPGRVLLGAAAIVLAGYAGSDLIFSPRLVATAEGVVVRSPLLRARLPWSDIEDVRAETRIRRGLRSTTLEIDAGAVLAVFSQRALGADPRQVAAIVRAFRPAT